jgi:DNA-3-methyladenine glycosylase I
VLTADWGSTRMVSRGRLFDLSEHDGFVAEVDEEWLGYATFHLDGDGLEVTVLEALEGGRGAGSALLAACVTRAVDLDLQRVWLITTNDNLEALRFYQKRGWELVALHRGAVDEARRTLKPEIPESGNDGIPIRDELELELPRSRWRAFVEEHGWPPS